MKGSGYLESKICSRCNELKTLDQFYSMEKVKANGEQYTYYFPYCKECNIKKSGEWISNNKARHARNTKRYYENNPEAYQKKKDFAAWQRASGYQKQYQEENRDKFREYSRNRGHRNHNISQREWDDCLEYFNYSCAYCGIVEDEAKELQGQYLHKEHAINDGANDLSNCIPACRSCNSRKSVWNFDDWYTEDNPVYSKRRYNKIIKWFDEDYKKYIKIKN